MYEGDPGAPPAGSGRLVHEAGALRRQVGEGRLYVHNRVGDVMEPLAPPAEEPAHRSVGVERGQQLDEGPADREHGLLDSLFLDHLPVHRRHPVPAAVVLDGPVEVVDGDSHMVEVQELHRDSVARCRTCVPIG